MTNVMAQLRTSVRVAAGSAADVGSFLRVEKLGRHVMTDSVPDDFTVEMFVRPDMSPSNISRAGLEGGNLYGGWNWSFATIGGADAGHSPAFGYGVYNTPGGCLRAPYDNYGSYSTGNLQGRDILWIQNGVQWQKSFYNGEWHHVAFVYSKAEQKMSLYIDYALAGNVKWEKDADKGNFPNGIPLVGDSFFQVLGKVGSTSMHSGADIAAVRIAKAAMPASAFMRAWHDLAENPTVAWWRFDEGTPGAAFGACTSVVASALGRSPMVMVAGRTGSVATPRYGRPVRTGVKEGQNAVAERNLAGVTGSANESDLTGLCLSVTGAPDLALPGSFTAEGFYRLHVNPGASSPSNRQPLMNESMADGSIAWGVRTQGADSIVLMCCRVTNLVTRAEEAWYDNSRQVHFPLDKWHHVAVVYDDEARPRTLQLYLDYEAVGEPITFDDTQALKRADNGAFVPVGYYANNANISWCGSMDEFRFTRKALTPAGFLQASGILGLQLIFK
jgi:hypothetical protein